MHGKGLGFRVTFLRPRATTRTLTHTATPPLPLLPFSRKIRIVNSRGTTFIVIYFLLPRHELTKKIWDSESIFLFLLQPKIYFRWNAEHRYAVNLEPPMPRTFPWGPFRVRVRVRAMARTVMHFRSERRKGQKKARVGRRREREGRKSLRERSVDVRVAKNQCILCTLWPLAVSFERREYRPAERSNYENTRKRSIRRLFIAFFLFFLSISFCASRRVHVSHVLSRLLAYSITGVSCYGIRHVQRSRLRLQLRTESIDYLFDAFPVAYHVSHILIQKTLIHTS